MIINQGSVQAIRKPKPKQRKVPAAQLPPPLETAVQSSIVQYLRTLGYHVSIVKEHYNRDEVTREGRGKFSTPGIPDLICCKDGMTFFLEVKRPKKGVMRDSQKKWHAEYKAHGGLVWTVNSTDQTKEALAELAVIEQNRRRCISGSSADDR